MPIDITDKGFIINGTASEVVAKTLQDSGLSSATVAEIIGGWFVGVTGAAEPVPFRFTTVVEATDPGCDVTYSRQFAHTDWIDGESRVQAGLTPEELGFNARFHAVENEFDAIADQLEGLGSCAAGIRADLVGVVRELEAKITALQNEIHARRQEETPPTGPKFLGTVTIDEQPILITQFDDDFKFVGFQEAPIRAQVKFPVGPLEPVRPEWLIDVTAGLGEVLAEPGVAVLWQPGEEVTVGDLRTNPATAAITLPTGNTLGQVLATMPAETSFASASEAVTAIMEHLVAGLEGDAAARVRTEVVTAEGADRTGGALLSSGVTVLGLDEATTRAVAAAGFGTVGRLAGASPTEVAAALTAEGLAPEAASRVVARAIVARAVRNVGPR
jgi:hypothetical protein